MGLQHPVRSMTTSGIITRTMQIADFNAQHSQFSASQRHRPRHCGIPVMWRTSSLAADKCEMSTDAGLNPYLSAGYVSFHNMENFRKDVCGSITGQTCASTVEG